MITYKIKHKFKEEMIVPINAVWDNINFITEGQGQHLLTTDKVYAIVNTLKFINIVEEKELVNKIYKLEWHKLFEMWHSIYKEKLKCNLSSTEWIYLKLVKDETNSTNQETIEEQVQE